jgi:MFS superfamily sulfate permease-like transporter
MERIPGTTVWWPKTSTFSGEPTLCLLVVTFQAPLSFRNADLFRRDLTVALDRADRRIQFGVLEASSRVEIDYSAALALRQTIETWRNEESISRWLGKNCFALRRPSSGSASRRRLEACICSTALKGPLRR